MFLVFLLCLPGAPMPSPASIFFGIKSGVSQKYFENRQRWRESDCPSRYAAAGITWKFFVGVPLDENHTLHGHNQGGLATDFEADIVRRLRNESLAYKDLQALSFRDQYMDLSYKTIEIMTYGFWFTEASFIGTHDDEFCLDVPKVLKLMSTALPQKQLLYAGHHLWSGSEDASMRGKSGTVAPYFSGWAYFLQRELVWYAIILSRDWAIFHQDYGTASEDSNMGKWVAHAENVYGIRVKMAQADIVSEI